MGGTLLVQFRFGITFKKLHIATICGDRDINQNNKI